MEMKPGQLTPNELETAILERLASKTEPLRPLIGRLHVLSRKFTGVGSFTDFNPDPMSHHRDLGNWHFELDGLIAIPHVPNGMGAILFCKGGCPAFLEMFTYGNEHWDGSFEGFSIEKPDDHK